MDPVKDLLHYLVQQQGLKSEDKALYYVSRLVRDVPLEGKRVLDIGCGKGYQAAYVACRGAGIVVGLEPEAEGTIKGDLAVFRELIDHLSLRNVSPLPLRIQDYDPGDLRFDLVLMGASINHIEEDACIRLQVDEAARETYRAVLRKMHSMMAPGATIVLGDATRYNLFGTFGLRNPLGPAIEHHKHQSPAFWSRLFQQCGFQDPRYTWEVRRPLTRFGRLSGNAAAVFLLGGSFRLVMTRGPS